ncbi:polyprenyl synthetase family protein [Streptomyces triticiradicis]|uniref:Polyprenyl synthetase family protein n=1 Tax=Streptomyces triticiradicis TaxID=2651189 RepID=A0A7J5D496_9ACTN|nr:polyprenyl synthetase family protein [Streptomyces triticiradicis]
MVHPVPRPIRKVFSQRFGPIGHERRRVLPDKAHASPAAGRPLGLLGASRQSSDTAGPTRPPDSAPHGGRAEGTTASSSLPHHGDLRSVSDDVAGAVGRVLERLLGDLTERAAALDPVFAHDLAERVARFTLDGGKRTRSQFLWWALVACGGREEAADPALRIGAALELIQTCALVHDDVMDGSAVRRGLPALHADVEAQYSGAGTGPSRGRFGEAAAILAGDLALAWADDVVADTRLSADTAFRVRSLWSAMRMEMVAGQYLDVQGQATSSLSPARAIRAACLKTALYSVERPLALGAALAGADATTAEALCSAGRCVGIAFQLRDDLQGVFGAAPDIGKPTGDDIRSGKPTYLFAVARAKAETAGDRGAILVLDDSFGRAGLSESDLARVRDVLVSTGARETVETKIDRLVAQGMRHLDGAALEPDGRHHLRRLLRAAAAPRPARVRRPGTAGAPDGTPEDLLICAGVGKATR